MVASQFHAEFMHETWFPYYSFVFIICAGHSLVYIHSNKTGVIMSDWVLILGCSTGHGGATAKRLAKDGYGIIGFHFDRGDVKKEFVGGCDIVKEMYESGELLEFFNTRGIETKPS